jgi:hypothetical protein
MNSIRILVFGVLAANVLAGCASNRLKGPIHAAEDPPWIAVNASHQVAPMELRYRVLLIGDTGLFLEGDPTLDALRVWSAASAPSSVVFLGDNVYNEGLVDDDREHGEKVLTQLLESTPVPKFFVPGNHDWGFAPKNHIRETILNQQRFVDAWPDGSAAFLPRDGCIGPVKRILHEAAPGYRDVVLLAMDPTPWINPKIPDACPQHETHASSLAALEQDLELHAQDFVLVVSHYPLRTGGPHGGLTYGVIGDMITTVLSWSWGGLMNTDEPTYADWIAHTQDVLREHPPLAYAAGHDHNLQLLEADDFARIEIVSGAGARDRVSTVTNIPSTIFAHAAEGFVVLDIGLRDGEEVVVVRVVETAQETPVFEMGIP